MERIREFQTPRFERVDLALESLAFHFEIPERSVEIVRESQGALTLGTKRGFEIWTGGSRNDLWMLMLNCGAAIETDANTKIAPDRASLSHEIDSLDI
ncbi:hypothetical protein ASF83_10715 [Plantibacter sp. Leaf171]|nr:hypothetical protein ASE44_10730 [Plantibacter sp. Leaf1]KQR59441.1 hypothetical protein ASF83_10715 [Plantibacter sp. Leaf171]